MTATPQNPIVAAQVAEAVRDAALSLAGIVAAWTDLNFERRLRATREAVACLTTLRTHDLAFAEVALRAFCAETGVDQEFLRAQVEERATLMRHLPAVLKTHRTETEAKICTMVFA